MTASEESWVVVRPEQIHFEEDSGRLASNVEVAVKVSQQ